MSLEKRVTIAVDAMTAEDIEIDGKKLNGIEVILEGVQKALPDCDSDIILVGNEDILKKEIKKYNLDGIQIENASELIGMHEHPRVVNKKEKASVVVAAKLVADDKANVFLSAGNTGASVMASTRYIGRIEKGSHKGYPCIALSAPTVIEGKYVLWLDGGAMTNISSMTPENILKSAIEGAEYAKYIFGIKKPLIGLHNVGEEHWKGPEFLQNADKLLYRFAKEYDYFAYYGAGRQDNCGFIEANHILKGLVDVVVADGYVGNSILKAFEGVKDVFKEVIVQEAKKKFLSKAGLGLMKLDGAFDRVKKRFSGSGGAHALGFLKPTIILHGKTKPDGVTRAILFAEKYYDAYKINKGIEDAFSKLDSFYSRNQ